MSHFHNGKPLWCRPAPTKTGSIWSPEDKDEEATALSEMPGLIAKAIKAGLVQRPAQEPKRAKVVASWQKAQCEQCGAKFQLNQMRHVWCEPCRNPPIPCFVCGTPFRKRHSRQTACSVECSKERQRTSLLVMAAKKRKPMRMVECIICRETKPARQAGGTFAKTCSKECASVYRKQKGAEYKQNRATQK